MKINPKIKKLNNIFYNNICLIMLVFSLLCFLTCFSYVVDVKTVSTAYNTKQGQMLGPINVDKKPIVYVLEAYFNGRKSAVDFSAEVLNEDKDTLYEVGRELWHEEGYDSDGYWSESQRKMAARLNFYEKGKYYIRFGSGDSKGTLKVTIKKSRGSYVPYFILGFWLLFISLIAFCMNNSIWIKEVLVKISENMDS